jgi:hypothetical protein
MIQLNNADQPVNSLITPPDQFNRITAFVGLTKKEWLSAHLFIAAYNRSLYNRDVEEIIIRECKETAEKFFEENTEVKIIE